MQKREYTRKRQIWYEHSQTTNSTTATTTTTAVKDAQYVERIESGYGFSFHCVGKQPQFSLYILRSIRIFRWFRCCFLALVTIVCACNDPNDPKLCVCIGKQPQQQQTSTTFKNLWIRLNSVETKRMAQNGYLNCYVCLFAGVWLEWILQWTKIKMWLCVFLFCRAQNCNSRKLIKNPRQSQALRANFFSSSFSPLYHENVISILP